MAILTFRSRTGSFVFAERHSSVNEALSAVGGLEEWIIWITLGGSPLAVRSRAPRRGAIAREHADRAKESFLV